MMLPFPVHIDSIGASREISPLGPHIRRYFTVSLHFQNTTIETDIEQDDPRYQTIKDHLISVGRYQGDE